MFRRTDFSPPTPARSWSAASSAVGRNHAGRCVPGPRERARPAGAAGTRSHATAGRCWECGRSRVTNDTAAEIGLMLPAQRPPRSTAAPFPCCCCDMDFSCSVSKLLKTPGASAFGKLHVPPSPFSVTFCVCFQCAALAGHARRALEQPRQPSLNARLPGAHRCGCVWPPWVVSTGGCSC